MLNFLSQFSAIAFVGSSMVTILSMFLQSVIPTNIAATLDQFKDMGMGGMLLFGCIALWRKLHQERDQHRADMKERDTAILGLATTSIAASTTIVETNRQLTESNRHLVDEVRRLQPPSR